MKDRRFYVLGPLMGGADSQAFLGQELSPGGRLRPVVLVFLPEELIEDKDVFERIRRETQQAVRLDHLNIITVLGLVKLEDGFARVVEFADAESVRTVVTQARLDKKKIPPEIAAAVVADCCAGVQYAHEVGMSESGTALLHGAVRPGTLLVTFKGVGMVTGYGAAAIVEGRLRAQGDASMRDPYTAPEQAFGGRKAATTQTDVYGLGAVLFELLSGRPPLESAHAIAIASIDPSRSRLGEVPEPLVEIVLKAISKKSKDRFETPAAMRDALLDQGRVATKRDVAAFMEQLFPPDMPQLQARRALLRRGNLEYDTLPPPPEDEAESAMLVWRYPVREIEAKPVAPPDLEKALTPVVPMRGEAAPEPPKLEPPAPEPPKPEAPRSEAPGPAPPISPRPTDKSRWVLATIILSLVLIGGVAFVLGVYFSNQMEEREKAAKVVPHPAFQETAQKPEKPIEEPPAPKPVKKPIREPARKPPTKPPPARNAPTLQTSRASTGTLNIQAPAGSKVFVGGKFKGVTPLKNLVLPVGQHKVVVEKEGGGSKYERVVPIQGGQQLTLTVEFF